MCLQSRENRSHGRRDDCGCADSDEGRKKDSDNGGFHDFFSGVLVFGICRNLRIGRAAKNSSATQRKTA
jgi:hypothetical protein